MKLEIKHIAPYLPYDLTIRTKDKEGLLTRKIVTKVSSNGIISCAFLKGGFQYDLKLNDLKPILRPLSDLTKEISNGVGLFYPFEELNLCYSDVTNFLNEDLYIGQWWDYEKVSKLIEWHFDIFGLIENGLAIDINTLDK